MASNEDIRRMIQNASHQEREQYRFCWNAYLASIESQNPQIIIPKFLGDQLGNDAIEAMARRFGILVQATIVISRGSDNDTYHLGPAETLAPGQQIITSIHYQPHLARTSAAKTAKTSALQSTLPQTCPAKQSGSCSPERKEKIPKPSNCFILYRADRHATVKAQNPGLINIELSKIIGKMWAEESIEVREHYKNLASSKKQQVLAEHPNWKCSPRKSSEIKKRSASTGNHLNPEQMHHTGAPSAQDNTIQNQRFDQDGGTIRVVEISPGNFAFARYPDLNPSGPPVAYSLSDTVMRPVQPNFSGTSTQMSHFDSGYYPSYQNTSSALGPTQSPSQFNSIQQEDPYSREFTDQLPYLDL